MGLLSRPTSIKEIAYLASHLDLLSRRNNRGVHGCPLCRDIHISFGLTISRLIESNPEPPETRRGKRPNLERALPNPTREHHGIDPLHRCGHPADATSQRVHVDVASQPRSCIALGGPLQDLTHVGRTGKSGQAGISFQRLPDLDRRQAAMLLKPEGY